MGLIYSSSDSENLINGLRANIGSAKAALEDLVSASQRLTSYIGAGRALDGAAFNAGKDLFSALIIPTIHRASSVFDDIKKHLSQYESANGEVSGEGVLDKDKLNAKKASIQAIKAETDNQASTFRTMASVANGVSFSSVGALLNEAVQSYENYSESLQQDLDKIEDKLRKLYNFNSSVNGLFNDDLNNFKLVVQSVAVLNETVVDSKTGSYSLPKGIDESWFTSIKSTKNSEKDEQDSINEEYNEEIDKELKEIDNMKNEEDESWWNQPAKEDIFDKITDWLTGDKENSKTQGEEVLSAVFTNMSLDEQEFSMEITNDFQVGVRGLASGDRVDEVLGSSEETPVFGSGDDAESGLKTELDYVTTSGIKLEATPGKTTTVLGTYADDTANILDELGNVKSIDFGPRDGGFNLLNTPDEIYSQLGPDGFWNQCNKPWLDNAIDRGDIIKIATEPTYDNLHRVNNITGEVELTGFGKEFEYLRNKGYNYDPVAKSMIKN